MINDEYQENSICHDLNYDSNILLTQYSSGAFQLIKSIPKKISFVVIILMVIASMTTFDLVKSLWFTSILSDKTRDVMIIYVSIFLIIFTLFIIKPLFKSQNIGEMVKSI